MSIGHCVRENLSYIPLLSSEAWQRLKTVYQHPGDIELFPAGLSETPTESGKLGPTFACIVAKQFQDLKFGDRYCIKLILQYFSQSEKSLEFQEHKV